MLTIRPFNKTDEDFAALIAINELLEPAEKLTIEMLRRSDEYYIEAYGFLTRYMVEVDGRVVGSGLYFPSEDDKNTLIFSMHIQPDFQATDVPAQLQAFLLNQIDAHHPQKVAAEPREDHPYRVRLLEDAGFKLLMRFPRSQMDVTDFDATSYQPIFDRLRAQAVTFVTLTDIMQSDPDWQHNVWRMFDQINRDVPYPEPAGETPFAEYAKYYEGEFFRPDSWAIALDTTRRDGAQYVGMCVVNQMQTRPDSVFAGITGTVRSHRRRKIATALKVKSAVYTKQIGRRFILTNNEENNPMYELNMQLGFTPLPANLYYEKAAS